MGSKRVGGAGGGGAIKGGGAARGRARDLYMISMQLYNILQFRISIEIE